MSVDADLAHHEARLDGHDVQHAEHKAAIGDLWKELKASRDARDVTNTKLGDLLGEVRVIASQVTSVSATVDRLGSDYRWAAIGGFGVALVLAALLIIQAAKGNKAVADLVEPGVSTAIQATP